MGKFETLIIPEFRNEVYKLQMPRKALSGHVCSPWDGSLHALLQRRNDNDPHSLDNRRTEEEVCQSPSCLRLSNLASPSSQIPFPSPIEQLTSSFIRTREDPPPFFPAQLIASAERIGHSSPIDRAINTSGMTGPLALKGDFARLPCR
jgi:hypothetical protein